MDRLPEITDAMSFWTVLAAQAGDVAFDVGANIGQAAHLMAPHFGRVFSYEPCQEALAILMVEAPPNVTVVPKALSNQAGGVDLDETENSIRTGQLTTGTGLGWGRIVGQRRVESTTLDGEVDRLGVVPDVVKVDTEGHEVRVLLGAKQTIALRRTTWLLEVHSRHNEDQVYGLLDGYRVERVDHEALVGREMGRDHFYVVARP